MLIITGDYCTIKAEVAVLVQDSLLISDTTIQNIQSTVKRLFSTLEAKDPSAIYNFAFAMYAERRKMSPFGSKEDTIMSKDKEIKRCAADRDLGNKNLLNRTLNKMISDRFMRRPKNTEKVSVNYGYAKLFAYINNMPWGHANYEYKEPRYVGRTPCTLLYAKSSAYINNMPWGHVNYEYKGPRWAHPLHSTLGRR